MGRGGRGTEGSLAVLIESTSRLPQHSAPLQCLLLCAHSYDHIRLTTIRDALNTFIPRSAQVPFKKGTGSRNQPESWKTSTVAEAFIR